MHYINNSNYFEERNLIRYFSTELGNKKSFNVPERLEGIILFWLVELENVTVPVILFIFICLFIFVQIAGSYSKLRFFFQASE